MTVLVRSPRLQAAVAAVLLIASLGLTGCRARRPRNAPDRGATAAAPQAALPRRATASPPPPAAGARARPSPAARRVPNVVICVLDAARADRFGCYGYPRETTPNVDRLARESVIFRNHLATCAATTPSTASLFTGLYPDALGMGERTALDEHVPTLAEALRGAGYRTALFTSNISASPETGLGRGFEAVFPQWMRLEKRAHVAGPPFQGRAPDSLTRDFKTWLADQGQSPFFAYFHFLPPHWPYEASESMKQAVTKVEVPPVRPGPLPFPELESGGVGEMPFPPQEWADLYDANLRRGDWGIGEVVRLLRARGVLDDTVLIVTADHGEAFGEHGYPNHVFAVYDEMVHIPLLIRLPGGRRAAAEVSALTQTVDLLPTICELCQVPYPHPVQGRSLAPLLRNSRGTVRDYAFAVSAGSPWPSYLVQDRRWSLLLYRGGTLRALYDRQADPAQQRNVIAKHPEAAAKLIAAFKSFARTQGRSLAEYTSPAAAAAPAAKPPSRPLSEKAQRELRALGYLK